MIALGRTVAFQGVEASLVDVQVQIGKGLPSFTIVGLPDKAVAESRERIRAALNGMGLSLPPKRIVVNLAPADLPKEGSHYDLPVALVLLAAMEIIPAPMIERFVALGELGLDASLAAVSGVLPAALKAYEAKLGLICPHACGGQAAWSGLDVQEEGRLIAPENLLQLVNHFKGTQLLTTPQRGKLVHDSAHKTDLKRIRGQESAKRALEIAAAGCHNMLMSGPPGAGKSLLAACLPGISPPLTAREALEVSVIQSLSVQMNAADMTTLRPFRTPHHSASQAAMIGGGPRAKPGEISLAHNGILFLDEFPEFPRPVLDSLRQPLESGETLVARARAHITYPSRFQLIAAMNPCRCGYATDPARACGRQPRCVREYQSRISGPLMDRIDIFIEVPPVEIAELALPEAKEGNEEVRKRVAQAREIQSGRFTGAKYPLNAFVADDLFETFFKPDREAAAWLERAAEKWNLTARGYHRVLRVARTISDLAHSEAISKPHVAEALNLRRSLVPLQDRKKSA